MLICARQQQRFPPFQDLPPLDDVRKDHSIQVADMRGSIDVEYRRGDVVWFLGRRLGGYTSITIGTNPT
jgi:hypothetical protein